VHISQLERGERAPHPTTVELLAQALALHEEPERSAFLRAGRRAWTQRKAQLPVGAETEKESENRKADVVAAVGSCLPAWPLGGFLGAAPQGPLVAWPAELRRLAAALEAVVPEGGAGLLLVLVGEPGIGVDPRVVGEAPNP
jgi:hypothetical protein